MVSHAWSENAIEFLECIVRSCNDEDVIFICAFAIYQCGDDAGPTISQQLGTNPADSPFQKVLEHIHTTGTAHGTVREWWYRQRTSVGFLANAAGLMALGIFFAPPVLDGVVYTLNF